MRAVVNCDLAAIQSVTPFTPRIRRQLHRSGVGRTFIPLQFIASTCIAQNACVARLRMSVLTENRC